MASRRRRERKVNAPAISEVAELRADTWCIGEHWGRHRGHLDLDLDIDVQEFA